MDSVLNLLGLALRGGRLAVGDESAAEACRLGRARLMLTAADAAGNSVDRAVRLAGRAGIPHIPLPRSRQALGAALGRDICAVAALTDAGLAAALVKRLAEEDPGFRPPALSQRAEENARPQKKKSDPRSAADRSN